MTTWTRFPPPRFQSSGAAKPRLSRLAWRRSPPKAAKAPPKTSPATRRPRLLLVKTATAVVFADAAAVAVVIADQNRGSPGRKQKPAAANLELKHGQSPVRNVTSTVRL